MPQLHLYLPSDVTDRVRVLARRRGLPVSRYLAELVRREVGGDWPPDYFARVVGGWQGEPLVRPDQGVAETRGTL